MKFDNNKLRGKVREVVKTEAELAKQLKLDRGSLSRRFSGEVQFSRAEIMQMIEILDIPENEIGIYFFQRAAEDGQ